jgi:predicted RNA-binding Zn-ribbon protein involved in translation (DUF1610 family)
MKKVPKIWKQYEIDFLVSNYVEYGVLYCMKQLNRSKDSVKHKAIELGLNLKSKRYIKEEFIEIIKNSRSYSDAVRKLKLNDGHGNRKTVIKYINLYDVDISHFDYKGEQLTIKKKIDLKNILIENSTYNNTVSLKNRLYKEGLKKCKCEECGQGEIWKGKKMSLILDHKNGIHNDNRFENLRIICPNCNATLETHCGKNRNKK